MSTWDLVALILYATFGVGLLVSTRWRRRGVLLRIAGPSLTSVEIDRQLDQESRRHLQHLAVGALAGLTVATIAIATAPEAVLRLWADTRSVDYGIWANSSTGLRGLGLVFALFWAAGAGVGSAVYIFRASRLLVGSADARVARMGRARLVRATGPWVLYGSRLSVLLTVGLCSTVLLQAPRDRPDPYLGIGDLLAATIACVLAQIVAEVGGHKLIRIPTAASTDLELDWTESFRGALARALYPTPLLLAFFAVISLATVGVPWGTAAAVIAAATGMVLVATTIGDWQWSRHQAGPAPTADLPNTSPHR